MSSRVTLVSVRPDWHDTQLVPARGSDIAVAETERVLQDRLSLAYVPASPNECAVSTELCLPRSGAPAPAGDRRDDDDNDAHTHTRSSGVPGVVAGNRLQVSKSHRTGVRKQHLN